MNPLGRFLEASPSLAERLPGLERAARSEVPILILGEPGTGRSHLARAIHLVSPRGEGPLVEVDSAALPSSLVESELFGHRAGSFTGADRDRIGRVERAGGGSLLLDPVEELPLAVQPKLLRLLAERRFVPIGGSERPADVRFLAIGAEDMPERVRRGAFREDLWFRLAVFPLHLPPLRDRREDLERLLGVLCEDVAARLGRPAPALSERARAWMLEHPWPGNLRQLRNLLEREMILRLDGPLDPDPPSGGPRPRPLEELERQEIRRALAYTGGHQGRAAELLGISRKTLWAKRRRYGLP